MVKCQPPPELPSAIDWKLVPPSKVKPLVDREPRFPAIWVAYGEATNIAMSVVGARVECHALPSQSTALVQAELTVLNDKVGHRIEAKLRMPLPQGAQVVRYAFEMADGVLVDALALPKRKAAEVAYREREAGRNVSTTEQIEGNMFETTIFPLDFQVPRRFVVCFTCDLDAIKAESSSTTSSAGEEHGLPSWSLTIPFRLEKDLESVAIHNAVYPSSQYQAKHEVESDSISISISAASSESSKPRPDITIGKLLGQSHFSAFLPRSFVSENFASAPSVARSDERYTLSRGGHKAERKVCVLWDSSASCASKNESDRLKSVKEFFDELELGLGQAGERATYSLRRWSTFVTPEESGLNVESLMDRISKSEYDGGTNLDALSSVFLEEVDLQSGASTTREQYDMFLLFTDGLDNIGGQVRLPRGVEKLSKPIHVITPVDSGACVFSPPSPSPAPSHSLAELQSCLLTDRWNGNEQTM